MKMSSKKNFWTEHSKIKMKQYGLSKQKLLSILYKPERKEQGIAPGTMAVMRTNKVYPKNKNVSLLKNKWPSAIALRARQKKAPGEIWLMYKDVKDIRRIISAWRYPGISKPGEDIPIPEDIRQEILKKR